MMNLTKTLVWTAAAVVVLGGCANKDGAGTKTSNDFFKGDAHGESVQRFTTVQSSNGARNDAMLYDHHFTAGHLNSLGRQKVLLMLEDCDTCDPIVVHLVNAGEGDVLAQRKQAVELYLKTAEGPNALTFHPASPDLIRFAKTESGKPDDGATSDTASAGGASVLGGEAGK